MSFAEDYLFEEVSIAGRGTTSKYGGWNYNGAFRTVKARVVEKAGIIKLPNGKEHAFTFEVVLPAAEEIVVKDRITFGGENYEIVEVKTVKMLDGTISHKVARVA